MPAKLSESGRLRRAAPGPRPELQANRSAGGPGGAFELRESADLKLTFADPKPGVVANS
jgi:hypothetical protein